MGTLPKRGRVERDVDAPAAAVWKIVADVTRTGEWSGENQGNDWVDGATSAAVGARFRGRNQQGRSKWTRVCEVTALDDPREFVWRTIRSPLHPDVTEWHIELTPLAGDRTHVVLHYEVLEITWIMDRVYYVVAPAHRDRLEALAQDIERLGALAHREHVAALS